MTPEDLAAIRERDHPTFVEWQTRGRALFGDDPHDWVFVCPSCGDVCTGREFHDAFHDPAGPKGGWLDLFGRICIGRLLGAIDKAIPKGAYKGRGCDWTAFGLFRGPVIVTFEDGQDIGVFRFGKARARV